MKFSNRFLIWNSTKSNIRFNFVIADSPYQEKLCLVDFMVLYYDKRVIAKKEK